MKFERITKYKDGSIIKHVANRSVKVASNRNKIGGVIIEFRRADLEKDEIGKSPVVSKTIKGKVEQMGFAISREAALALYVQLGDYFIRVDPESEML